MAAYYKLGQEKDFPAVNFHQLQVPRPPVYPSLIVATQDARHLPQRRARQRACQRSRRPPQAHSRAGCSFDRPSQEQQQDASTRRGVRLSLGHLRKRVRPLHFRSACRRSLNLLASAGPGENGPNGCRDRSCSEGTLAMGWGSGTANFPYLVDPYSALQNFIHSVKGNAVIEAVLNDYSPQVATIASLADVCLVFAVSSLQSVRKELAYTYRSCRIPTLARAT